MDDNIIKIGNSTMIFNGGNPLPRCPESWDQAYAIEAQMNEGKEKHAEPIWDFDCGFKLDFDGPLLRVSSRFYPPKTHYGATLDGSVSIFIKDECVAEKEFDCSTLHELREQVETYVTSITEKLKNFCQTSL